MSEFPNKTFYTYRKSPNITDVSIIRWNFLNFINKHYMSQTNSLIT